MAAARAAAVALPLPLPAFKRPPRPHVRPAPRPAPAAPRERVPHGLGRRAVAFATGLPDHSLLDRVVRGGVWIPLLGVLLAGIVAAQVEILKLGASMGQALEQTSTLTTQNEQLRGSVAALADDQRIERLAGGMGMVLPPPGAVGYLLAGRNGNVAGALGNLHTADAAAFVTMPAKNGALVTGPGTSTLPPAPGAPAPPPATATPTSGTTVTGTAAGTPSQSSATSSQATTPGTTASPQTTSQQTPTQQTPTQQTPTQQTPTTNSSTQSPATGAAAIQPSDSSQSTSGG